MKNPHLLRAIFLCERTIKIFFTLTIFLGAHVKTSAASADLDPTFAVGIGAGFPSDSQGFYWPQVQKVAVQADGKVIAGGQALFTNFNGTPIRALCRINVDGSIDTGFLNNLGSGTATAEGGPGEINDIAIQPDGKILIVGDFASVDGASRSAVARLNANGSLDTGFMAGGGGVGGLYLRYVRKVELQADGKILIAGGFTSFSGTSRPCIARLNSDGTLDTSFAPGFPTGAGTTFALNALAIRPDGKIYVGGGFTNWLGQVTPGLVRLESSGAPDTSFYPTHRYPYPGINTMCALDDGRVLVGGFLEGTENKITRYFARLNNDGSIDASYPASGLPGGLVMDIQPWPGGGHLISGRFRDVGGQPRGEVALLDANGNLDSSFAPALVPNSLDDLIHIYTMGVAPDGKIVIGGWFTNFPAQNTQLNGQDYSGIGRLVGGYVAGPGTIQLVSTQIRVDEEAGTATISVSRFGSSGAVSVHYATSSGTAGASDFTATSGTLSWAGGESGTKTFTVAISSDTLSEGTENFSVTLSSPTGGATLGTSLATVTIVDDDSVPEMVTQPESQSVFIGSSVTFHVGVESGLAVTYQWRSNSVDIVGATNAFFTMSNVQTNFAAGYSVRITNAKGFVDSAEAQLTVVIPAGLPDPNFVPPGIGFNQDVYALAFQSTGQMLVGGGFSQYGGVSIPGCIARLNLDGTRDATFASSGNGANSIVYVIGTYPDGKLMIAGAFSQYAGTARSKLARLNEDGSLDVTFANPNISGTVYAAFPTPDGGAFTGENGRVRKYLPSGTNDTNFNSVPMTGQIYALASQPDGKIIAAPYRTTGGIFGSELVRLNPDGSRDFTFTSPGRFSSQVQSLAIMPDGRIVVAGGFSSMITENATNPVPRLAVLNPDGSLDDTFNLGTGPDDSVISVLVQDDGKILCGGAFTKWNGQNVGRLMRLLPDGTMDPTFIAGTGANNYVRSVSIDSHGRVAIGGSFSLVNGLARGKVALLTDGPGSIQLTAAHQQIAENAGSVTVSVARLAGSRGAAKVDYTTVSGTAVSGSDFTAATGSLNWADGESGVKTINITLNNDAAVELDESFSIVLSGVTNAAYGIFTNQTVDILDDESTPRITLHPVDTVAPEEVPVTFFAEAYSALPFTYQWLSNSIVIPNATNAFLTLPNVQSNFVATYSVRVSNANGSTDSSNAVLSVIASPTRRDLGFIVSPAFNNNVRAIFPLGDGRVLVGGDFTQPASKIVLLNADGTKDTSFTNTAAGSGTVSIYDIERDGQGRWLIGGKFSQFAGVTASNLVRLNPDFTLDTDFLVALGAPPNDTVRDVAVGPDGKIWIGGDFTSVSGPYGLQKAARLFPDGSPDTEFRARVSNSPVHRIVPLEGGKAFLGGSFSSYDGSGGSLVRCMPDGSRDTTYNSSIAGAVYDLLPLPDGGMVVCGEFNTTSAKIAKLNAKGALDSLFLESVTASGAVNTLALQSNGRIAAGGAFATMGTHSNRFTRININGTLDNSINVGTGFSGDVYRIALEANGQIWVGGAFTQYKSAAPGYLVRLIGDAPTVAVATQPLDQVIAPGGTAIFSASAVGSGTLGYQWLKNGAPISNGGMVSGATTATLTLTGVSVAEEGNYSLLVTNDAGAMTLSRAAILSVQGAPAIVTQPVGGIVPVGGIIRLSIGAEGAPTLAYRWFKNGALVGSSPVFVLTNAAAGDSGDYQVVVSNSINTATSSVATVSVQITPATAAPGFFKEAGVSSFSTVNAMQPLPDGRLMVGGSFSQLLTNGTGATYRSNLGLFDTNGVADAFNPSASSQVNAIARQRDGKILVAGSFTGIGGQSSRRYLARFNADLTFDTNFHNALYQNFNTNGPDSAVSSIALQADGKILIAGGFTKVNGVTNRAIARLNIDGTLDASFTSFAPQYSSASLVDTWPDGRILLVGGGLYGGHSSSIYRLNPDGSVDKSFTVSGAAITAIAVQTNGAILVGGTFETLNNQTRPLLARLDVDGRLDTNFLAGVTSFSAYNQAVIHAIAVQDNGKILAGGNFLSFGPFRNGLVRVNADGTPDNTFAFQQGIGDDYSATVWGISLFADGRIAVGGQFATWEGALENNLVILSGDLVPLGFAAQPADQFVPAGTSVEFSAQAVGTSPVSYQWYRGTTALSDGGNISGATTPTLSVANVSGADAEMYSVTISNESGSRVSLPAELFILAAPVFRVEPVGGTFYVSNSLSLYGTVLGVAPLSYQWLLESNAIVDATNSALTFSSLQLSNGGNYQLIASNSLGAVTSAVATVSILLPPSAVSPTFTQPAGANGPIYSVVPLGDGRVVIGGQFSMAGPNGAQIARANMALLNTNGTADATFNPAPDGQIAKIVRDASGGLLVGGFFGNIGGQPRSYFARLNADGSLDTSFLANLGTGPNQFVYDVALQSDGKILLAGSFNLVSGQSYPGVVRLNSNGSIDTSFRLAGSGQVQTLSLRSDGRIYIGGYVTISNRQNIIRLNSDGSVDLTFNGSANSGVSRALAMPDGGVVIGGFFWQVDGANLSNFARLNSDGTLNASWPQAFPDGSVETMALQANGKLIVGGQFFSFGGQTRNRIARYNSDGSLDDSFAPGYSAGFNQIVRTLALESDGRIWVGGNFTTCNGASANYLSLLAGDPVTPGNGSPFENWAANAGLTSGNNAPDQDADNDGVLNVFEYYFGTSPVSAGSSSMPAGGSVNVGGADYPAITFVRVKDAAGVTLIPQASSNLNFSDSLGTEVESVIDLGGGLEQVTIRSTTSDASQPTQFLRIQLSVP